MKKQTQYKPNQTQFVVSKVEPPVVSLPVLSLPVVSLSNQSKGSNLFQRQKSPKKPQFPLNHDNFSSQLEIVIEVFRLAIMVDNSNLKTKRPSSDSNGSESEELTLVLGEEKRLKCGGHHTVFSGFAWNGITGRMELRIRPQVRITELQVYPIVDQKKIRLALTCTSNIETPVPATVSFVVRSMQTKTSEIHAMVHLECEPGSQMSTHEIKLGEEILLWDEFTHRNFTSW